MKEKQVFKNENLKAGQFVCLRDGTKAVILVVKRTSEAVKLVLCDVLHREFREEVYDLEFNHIKNVGYDILKVANDFDFKEVLFEKVEILTKEEEEFLDRFKTVCPFSFVSKHENMLMLKNQDKETMVVVALDTLKHKFKGLEEDTIYEAVGD